MNKKDKKEVLDMILSSQSPNKQCDGERVGSRREASISPLFDVSESAVCRAVVPPNTTQEQLSVPQPILTIPKWYKFFERKELKKKIIKERLDEYAKPFKVAGKDYSMSDKDILEYNKQLIKLDIKDLLLMGRMLQCELKLDPVDRLKSINKKNHAIVTIFNDNKTTDTGVCHCYDRTFSRRGMTYIIVSSKGWYDPEFKMIHFYYDVNNPIPKDMLKPNLPPDMDDAKLLDSTIEAKVIEALAAIDIDKKINMLLILGIITFLMSTVTMLVCLRGFEII